MPGIFAALGAVPGMGMPPPIKPFRAGILARPASEGRSARPGRTPSPASWDAAGTFVSPVPMVPGVPTQPAVESPSTVAALPQMSAGRLTGILMVFPLPAGASSSPLSTKACTGEMLPTASARATPGRRRRGREAAAAKAICAVHDAHGGIGTPCSDKREGLSRAG